MNFYYDNSLCFSGVLYEMTFKPVLSIQTNGSCFSCHNLENEKKTYSVPERDTKRIEKGNNINKSNEGEEDEDEDEDEGEDEYDEEDIEDIQLGVRGDGHQLDTGEDAQNGVSEDAQNGSDEDAQNRDSEDAQCGGSEDTQPEGYDIDTDMVIDTDTDSGDDGDDDDDDDDDGVTIPQPVWGGLKEKVVLELGLVSNENKDQNEKVLNKVVEDYISLLKMMITMSKDKIHKRINTERRRLIGRHYNPMIALVVAVNGERDHIREALGLPI